MRCAGLWRYPGYEGLSGVVGLYEIVEGYPGYDGDVRGTRVCPEKRVSSDQYPG